MMTTFPKDRQGGVGGAAVRHCCRIFAMRLLGTLWGMHDPKPDMKSGLLIGNRGYDLVLFGEVADVVMRCSKSQQSTIREIFLFKEDIRSTHLNDRFLAAGTNTGISTGLERTNAGTSLPFCNAQLAIEMMSGAGRCRLCNVFLYWRCTKRLMVSM
jgi:hypothetical protein